MLRREGSASIAIASLGGASPQTLGFPPRLIYHSACVLSAVAMLVSDIKPGHAVTTVSSPCMRQPAVHASMDLHREDRLKAISSMRWL